MRHRLALLIPAYNASDHLPRLLKGANKQTEAFDEVWVYDDASSDDTGAVAQRFGARVVRGDVNHGCATGKNILASRATCEWVHFHDADDELLPHFVATARKWMTNEAPDVVVFGYEERDSSSGQVTAVRRFDAEALRRDPLAFVVRTKIVSICGIYRRSRFLEAGGYDLDPAVLFNEDVAMHCQLALAGLAFDADAEVTVANHIRAESMSTSNPVKCIRAHYAVMRKVAAAAGSTCAREIAERLWITAASAASYLDWKTADDAAALAVRLAGMPRTHGSVAFRVLCRLSVRGALRIRELAVRVLKPRFRVGHSSLSATPAAGGSLVEP